MRGAVFGFDAGGCRPPIEPLDQRIQVHIRIEHLQHIVVCQPS
jgi:hypothetical protein